MRVNFRPSTAYLYFIYRYKERGTDSYESVLDLVQLICGDIYGKERGLTRESQF